MNVVVIGAGASAIDLAALLREQDCDVSIVTRRAKIEFHDPPRPHRSMLSRLRRPDSGIGGGWELAAYAREPRLFHALPESVRRRKVQTLLGPSAGWFMKDGILNKVPVFTGMTPVHPRIVRDRVQLLTSGLDGQVHEISAAHVISASGYRVDLRRLTFLSNEVLRRITQADNTPLLSGQFETSVRGLYMVGFAAVNDFGPLVRFVFGARYQARRLSFHLARSNLRARLRAPALSMN